MPDKQNQWYGIDFGTSNSAVSYIDKGGRPQIIDIDKHSNNPKMIRSAIYISKQGEISFGAKAVDKFNQDVTEAEAAEKKIVKTGRIIKVTSDASATTGYKPDKFVEQIFEAEESQTGRLFLSVKSLLGNSSLQKVSIFDKEYKIEEMVGIFLRELKKRADKFTGNEVDKVILGRPVNFVGNDNDLAVERLKKATKIAGFKQVILQLEPIGAAYDFGIDISANNKILVFDFGGGTLDLSIVKFPEKKIIINNGIPLGGDKINSRLFLEKFSSHFGKGEKYGNKQMPMPINLYERLQNWYSISQLKTKKFFDSVEHFSYKHSNPQSLRNLNSLVSDNKGFRLYEEIDRVKKGLSVKKEENFHLHLRDHKIVDDLYREEFEKIIRRNLKDIQELLDSTLESAGLEPEEIDDIAITGGSSLIPVVIDLLEEQFGSGKLKKKDTFTSVASGLALYGEEKFTV